MNGNNIRSPNYFVARWFFFFGIIFIVFFSFINVSADCGNYYPSEDVSRINLDDEDTNYNWNLYKNTCNEWSTEDNSFIVLRCSADLKEYNQVFYILIKWRGLLSFYDDDSTFKYSSDSSNLTIFYVGDLNKDKYTFKQYTRFYNNDSSSFGRTFYNCTLTSVNVNNVSIIYSNIRECDTLNGYNGDFPEANYDKNNLNEYPVNTINVVSPDDNITTNKNYIDVVIKGKIYIDYSSNLLGNAFFGVQDLGYLIRKQFRYSVVGDVESFDNLTYLGLGNKGMQNYILELMAQFGQDPGFEVDKSKVGDVNTIWACGVSGNESDWINKHYYNFIINTRLWCGYLNKDLKYTLNFSCPSKFSGNLTDVLPVEYKDITISYSLDRKFYSDDDFDGIDDESNEIIPPDEVEIIHPSTSTPSLPSDDGLDDGLQVVNILKDIYKDFCHGVNGSVNILKSFFSVVNSTVKSVCDYSQQMVISFGNIFSFMPSPIPQLITMSLAIMIFVSVLGFIKK